jgi:TPR repeat protein
MTMEREPELHGPVNSFDAATRADWRVRHDPPRGRQRLEGVIRNRILSVTLRATLTASVMLAGAGGSAVAGPLDQGDYAATYRLVLPLAEHGNAGAQAMLGEIYLNGQGVPEDYAEALKWFHKAADQGDAKSCHRTMRKRRNGIALPPSRVTQRRRITLTASA